jgi:hypothetical protein
MKTLLCFLFTVITGGALAPAGYSFLGQTSKPDTLAWRHIQVIVKSAPDAGIRVYTGVDHNNRQLIAYLTGEALAEVVAFSPEQPVPSGIVDWTISRLGPLSIEMSADLNGRSLKRRISINRDHQSVQIATSITLLGNEVVGSVFDNWTFPTPSIDFAWVPNLRPDENLVIGEHTFRSPAVVLESGGSWVALVPDLDSLPKLPRQRLAALDLNRKDFHLPRFGFGLKAHDPTFHVYYRHDPARVFTYEPGTITYAYDLIMGTGDTRAHLLSRVNRHLWNRYARPLLSDVRPQVLPFADYAKTSYATLDSIGQFVDFTVDGVPSGAYRAEDHGTYFMLPKPLVWNQVWFNAQRSAYGLAYYGSEGTSPRYTSQASLITNFSRMAPSWDGLFPAVHLYERSEWIGSPLRLNGGLNRVHAASAAWTAIWMHRTQNDLLPDAGTHDKVTALADFLVKHQQEDGSIPAWFDRDPQSGSITAHPVLSHSAETAGSAMLLGELAIDTGNKSYEAATVKAADFLIREVLPAMKYHDFELFWSCSWKSLDMTDPYTGVLPQNNYSIFWVAETFRYALLLSGNERYQEALLETIETLNLYQQVWNPNFLSLYAFGGFGVMNTDGEWNDSRQAVFAPMYMRAYQAIGDPNLMQRGIAALRASFALFAIPENCEISPYTCDAYLPGLSPESLAHSGANGTSGRSDSGWGEAGALTSAAYVVQHFGHVYVDTQRGHAFGIDGVLASSPKLDGNSFEFIVEEALGKDRTLTVRTADGRHRTIQLKAFEKQTVRIPASA